MQYDTMDDLEIIVRRLKIDLIAGTPNRINEWFEDLWSTLHICNIDIFHNNGGEYIYYKIVDNVKEYVFYRDDDNGIFYCSTSLYWRKMGFKFNYTYSPIQTITKILLEHKLSASIALPKPKYNSYLMEIEKVLGN